MTNRIVLSGYLSNIKNFDLKTLKELSDLYLTVISRDIYIR